MTAALTDVMGEAHSKFKVQSSRFNTAISDFNPQKIPAFRACHYIRIPPRYFEF
jgi:hypothetical protein